MVTGVGATAIDVTFLCESKEPEPVALGKNRQGMWLDLTNENTEIMIDWSPPADRIGAFVELMRWWGYAPEKPSAQQP